MRALVTGVNGQDGSFLAELLLEKGYEVYGTSRRSSVNNLKRISHFKDKLAHIYQMDLADTLSIADTIRDCEPDIIFHEADQDNVGWSYNTSEYSVDVTAGGVLRLLECVRAYKKDCKVFIPVSATMFGNASAPQNEDTRHNPLHPYGCAKSHAYNLARYYRQCHGMFVSTAILYGHHSERRVQSDYLLGYIYGQVRDIGKNGTKERVKIGSLDTIVDIGYAPDFVKGIYDLMQLKEPVDLVLGTGKGYKIQDIVCHYLKRYGLSTTNRIEHDLSFRMMGPATCLVADCSRAKEMIDWNPTEDAMTMFDHLTKSEV